MAHKAVQGNPHFRVPRLGLYPNLKDAGQGGTPGPGTLWTSLGDLGRTNCTEAVHMHDH